MAHATAAQPITVGSTPTWTATSPTPTTSSAAASAPVSVPTTPTGYQELLGLGPRARPAHRLGREGTGSYGAALARFLAANDQVVVEVNRPDRQARRRRGKSDPLGAEAAACAVQAGQATVAPKAGTGQVEMIRSLRVARTTAIRARTQAINALKALLVTARPSCASSWWTCQPPPWWQPAAALVPGPITSPLAAALLAPAPRPPPPGPQPRRSRP